MDVEQLRFCNRLLSDLHRKAHRNVVSLFYESIGVFAPFLRASGLFLTITLCRICFPEYHTPPEDHQGAHRPLDDTVGLQAHDS